MYVPTYNPTVVYGAWPYPAYPPYYYYPPGYVAGGALLGFTAGVIVGGALWGNCNWGGGNVNVNVNRYNNFNRTNISNGNWNHNAQHRGAVPYRDQGVAQQYGRGQRSRRRVARRFRGRADAGRERSSAVTCRARDARQARRRGRSARGRWGPRRRVCRPHAGTASACSGAPDVAQRLRRATRRERYGHAQRVRDRHRSRRADARLQQPRLVQHELGAHIRQHGRRRRGGGGGGGCVAAAVAAAWPALRILAIDAGRMEDGQ